MFKKITKEDLDYILKRLKKLNIDENEFENLYYYKMIRSNLFEKKIYALNYLSDIGDLNLLLRNKYLTNILSLLLSFNF
jgi:hypothetical protein